MKNKSITTKVVLWAFFLIATIGVAVSLIVSSSVHSALLSREQKFTHQLSQETTKHIAHIVDSHIVFVKAISMNQAFVDYFSSQKTPNNTAITQLIDAYQAQHPEYLSIYVMDATGLVHASSDRSFVNNTYDFRSYFQDALQGKLGTQLVTGVTSKQLGYYIAHPIYNSTREVIAVVAIKTDPSAIFGILAEDTAHTETHMMITNSDGVIMWSTEKDQEFRLVGPVPTQTIHQIYSNISYPNSPPNPLHFAKVQSAIQSYQTAQTLEVTHPNTNKESLVHVVQIPTYMSLFLVTESDLSHVQTDVRNTALVLGGGVLTAALLTFLILSSIIRKTLSPLSKVSQYAELISKGTLTEQISIKTSDEFESLGNTLEKMRINLLGLYTNLESKVNEKTQALTTQLQEVEQTKKAMINLLEDVNVQKDKETKQVVELQKFRLAVENVHDHIVITDENGIIIYANKAVETITGFSSAEILGKKAGSKELWGGYMNKETYEAFWNLVKNQKKTFIGEFKNRKKTGEFYTAEATVSPIIDQDGAVRFFVGIERDITRAKEVDKMKTEFISLASHQLRTPLSAMKWFLEMLLNGDAGTLNEEQKDFVLNVDQSNNRMIELVNSLLNVSRIESGRIIIEPKPTDIKKLIIETLEEVKVQYKDKKQTVIVNIHDSLPLISLDQKLMRQVYLNLFTNAMKYSPPETEIIIFVSKENDMIISQITDSGYGIPKNEQNHIFSKFYRATNAIKKETEGNGLGLYLVQSIVESSGGKIWFTSEEAKGTSFYFSIPLSGMKHKEGEVHLS